MEVQVVLSRVRFPRRALSLHRAHVLHVAAMVDFAASCAKLVLTPFVLPIGISECYVCRVAAAASCGAGAARRDADRIRRAFSRAARS